MGKRGWACRLTVLMVIQFVGVAAVLGQIDPGKTTSAQQREVKKIKALLDQAGKQYRAKNRKESARTVAEAQKRMQALVEKANLALIQLVQPEYDRLSKAHELLTGEDLELPELRPLPRPRDANGALMVLFQQDVAPILVAKCGNCHVNRSQGEISLASYDSIMKGHPTGGVTLFPGDAANSRIVEVIVDGDMPRGGLTVTDDELATLKAWIDAGAKYDGQDPARNLRDFATPADVRPPAPMARATGEETVSFALDVAPVLVEQCAGCHYQAQNARGNLNMTTFRRFLRGGSGGAIVKPGDGEGSEMVRRLRLDGDGRMPPRGRRVDEEKIAKIVKWIDEGAKFDGRNARVDLQNVIDVARAGAASHEDLSKQRLERALANWKLVMSNEPMSTSTDRFLVLGSLEEETLVNIAELADDVAQKMEKAVRLNQDQKLIKGRMTLYVFMRRYDFSEFGKMVQKREYATEETSSWEYDTISSYAVFNWRDSDSLEQVQSVMAHHIGANFLRSNAPDAPRWFADGYGYLMAQKAFPRDKNVKQWPKLAAAAVESMTAPDDFLTGKISDYQAGLVGFVFVQQLAENKAAFREMIMRVSQGTPFGQAFRDVYGASPRELATGRRNRRPRR